MYNAKHHLTSTVLHHVAKAKKIQQILFKFFFSIQSLHKPNDIEFICSNSSHVSTILTISKKNLITLFYNDKIQLAFHRYRKDPPDNRLVNSNSFEFSSNLQQHLTVSASRNYDMIFL